MNVFILASDPAEAASYLCDKHLVSQANESAQIISAVNRGPYKHTQAQLNHPCVKWAGFSPDNYSWLVEHAKAIYKEYTAVYNKRHAAEDLSYCFEKPIVKIGPGKATFIRVFREPFSELIPADLSIVEAYRQYYRLTPLPKIYSTRNEPSWLKLV